MVSVYPGRFSHAECRGCNQCNHCRANTFEYTFHNDVCLLYTSVKLCIENYNNALKLFEEGSYYRDAYVVLLNIIQTYLSRSEYAEAGEYLSKLSQLEDELNLSLIHI